MRYYIGIDPGLTGAIAVVDEAGQLVGCLDMPVESRGGDGSKKQVWVDMLAQRIRELALNHPGEFHGIVERVGARPGQGVVSMFNFGDSFGSVRGVLAGLQIPTTVVLPQVWKKHFGLVGVSKDASRLKAANLFPSAPVRRAKDHGRAEAILLAAYARERAHAR